MFLVLCQHHNICDFSRGHLLSELRIFDFFYALVYEPKVQWGLLVSQSPGLFYLLYSSAILMFIFSWTLWLIDFKGSNRYIKKAYIDRGKIVNTEDLK